MKKRSFFDRIAGTVPAQDDYDFDRRLNTGQRRQAAPSAAPVAQAPLPAHVEDDAEGQLPVDVYQTQNEIVIRTFVAGVRPDDLNVSISRDMVVIEGSRDERDQLPIRLLHRDTLLGSFPAPFSPARNRRRYGKCRSQGRPALHHPSEAR